MKVTGILKLIEELNLRVPKDYQKMNVKQLSVELQEIMKFEQETFQQIEEFEKNGTDQDLISYAKMICKNTTEREIVEIQKIYFEKIDTEYLKSK